MVAAGVVALTSLAFAVTAPQRMRLYDNIRLVYLERAPLLSHAVTLGALMSPPPPIGHEAPDKREDDVRHVDFSGRDVLLVTIDALRPITSAPTVTSGPPRQRSTL